jgi:hypothetical protein
LFFPSLLAYKNATLAKMILGKTTFKMAWWMILLVSCNLNEMGNAWLNPHIKLNSTGVTTSITSSSVWKIWATPKLSLSLD